jgi:hypothetical protein
MRTFLFAFSICLLAVACNNKTNGPGKSGLDKDSLFKVASTLQREAPVFGSEEFIKVYGIYNDVLKQDSLNVSANYNLGIMYYNQAIEKIIQTDSIAYISLFYNKESFEMPFGAFFDTLKLSQISHDRELISWFATAKKYFERAYKKDSSKVTLLMGLQGCYHFFNDSISFSKIGKKLGDKGDTLKSARKVSTD